MIEGTENMIDPETSTHRIPLLQHGKEWFAWFWEIYRKQSAKNRCNTASLIKLNVYLPASDRSLSQSCVSLDSAVHCPWLILHVVLSIRSIHASMRWHDECNRHVASEWCRAGSSFQPQWQLLVKRSEDHIMNIIHCVYIWGHKHNLYFSSIFLLPSRFCLSSSDSPTGIDWIGAGTCSAWTGGAIDIIGGGGTCVFHA